MDQKIKNQIKGFISGDIKDDEQTLTTYSKDASLFEIKPKLIIYPKETQDIKNLVNFVSKNENTPDKSGGFLAKSNKGLSITPRSGGTDMSGGALGESIILDMTKYFNNILEVTTSTATTQPGVYYRDFEKETLKNDLILPCYTASREICTVGGMVANNAAGEKTLIYGQTKNFVKKLKVILSDGNEYIIESLDKASLDKKLAQKDFEGEIYNKIYELIEKKYNLIQSKKPKVSKNSSGYLIWDVWDKNRFDLTKILVGSQGTLGIITEISFALVHPKKHSKLLVIYLNNLDNLGKITNKILQHSPESFESYDDYTVKVALKFLPEVIKSLKSSGNFLSLGLQFLPEALMALRGGLPKLVLLAQFSEDSEQEVDRKLTSCQNALKEFNLNLRVTKSESEAKKYWTLRRESFNLLRHHSPHKRTAPFIDDIVVNHQDLPVFLPKLKEILSQYNLIYTIAGHIGNGNFHIIPLMDLTDPKQREIIPELSKRVYDLVFEFKGSMTAEHNDGLIRGPYLEAMFGKEMLEIFKEVKRIFDPKDIFNPHKKADADFNYSMSHIATTSS